MIHQAILAVIRTVNSPCIPHIDQRCRSRRRSRSRRNSENARTNHKFEGTALVAQITVDQLHADSDWLMAGSEGEVENEERTAKINAHLQTRSESI